MILKVIEEILHMNYLKKMAVVTDIPVDLAEVALP